MTHRLTIFCLTIFVFLTTSFAIYGQKRIPKKIDKTQSKTKTNLQFDTSKTAIISFDKKGNYGFDNNCKPTRLTQIDIQNIDSLLIEYVTDYNNKLDKDDKPWSIDLAKYKYRKQLIAVTNKNGEKEVWVNCFCTIFDNWWSEKWRTEIMLVEDGGSCYFNFKLNLTTKKIYDFRVNGVA